MRVDQCAPSLPSLALAIKLSSSIRQRPGGGRATGPARLASAVGHALLGRLDDDLPLRPAGARQGGRHLAHHAQAVWV